MFNWFSSTTDPGDNNLRGKRVLFTGDSITAFTGIAQRPYHNLLAQWLGLTVLNDGFSGTGLVASYTDVPGIYDRMDTYWSRYGVFHGIVLMGNMNDGHIGVGTPADMERYPTVRTQYSIVSSTINKIIRRYPFTPLLWVTSAPRVGDITDPGNDAMYGQTGAWKPYNDAIVYCCAHYGVPCLDLYTESGLRPWVQTSAFTDPDRVHPNDIGHYNMAMKMYPFIKYNM